VSASGQEHGGSKDRSRPQAIGKVCHASHPRPEEGSQTIIISIVKTIKNRRRLYCVTHGGGRFSRDSFSRDSKRSAFSNGNTRSSRPRRVFDFESRLNS